MPIAARAKPRNQEKVTKKTSDRRELDAIHERVLEAVATLGDSPTAQAVQLGVSRSTLDRWFKPSALPTIQHLFRIADRTGFSVAWMLGLDTVDRGRTTLSVARTEDRVFPIDRRHLANRSHGSSSADSADMDLRAHVESAVDRALGGIRSPHSSPHGNALPTWVDRIRHALTERAEGIEALCHHAVRAEVFDSGNRYRKAMLELADLMTLDSARVFEPGLTERLLTRAADIRRFAESLSSFEAMVNSMPEMEHVGPIVGAGLGTSGNLVLESRFVAVAPSFGVVWRGKHRDYAWYLELLEDEPLPSDDGRDAVELPQPKLCAIAQKRGRFLKARAGMSFIEQLAALTGENTSLVRPDMDEDEAAFVAMLEMR
jgi:transcriptional regulator with XRE-family HTH domain